MIHTKNVRRSRGISPLIATIILVVITIVLSLGVAFWSNSLVSSFSSTERLEVRLIAVSPTLFQMQLKNVGSFDIQITDILTMTNGVQVTRYTVWGGLSVLTPGQTARASSAHAVPRGASFDVCVITTLGNTYCAVGTVP
ncbi:MAG: hypothetical protein NZ920_06215 [Aigarchaeota archaeon]|nr:hypothetical protein [Aigarchaeota archaeon]